VDSGYALRPGYMVTHCSNRYHMKEFKNRCAGNLEEMFNYHHSKLRNVVERTFGCAKICGKC